MINIFLINNLFIFENESDFQKLNSKRFGKYENKLFQLDLFEALYLLELDKIKIIFKKSNKKNLNDDIIFEFKDVVKYFKFNFKEYLVFKDLRSKGYYVASGFKYGTTFRVYDKGLKPGLDHAYFLVEVKLKDEKISFKEISSKNRVAHSTKKRLVFSIIDEENSILYFENTWIKF